jgi:hypothetical protein
MLQGLALSHLLAPMAVLLLWLVVTFSVSLRIFRWR